MCSQTNKDTDSPGMTIKPVMCWCCLVIPATTKTKVDIPLRHPPRIPAESSTKRSEQNNHPLFTTISDVFYSLHAARFFPFVVWIPQIHVASCCGGGGDPKYLLNRSKLLSLQTVTDPNSFPKIRHKTKSRHGGFSVVSFLCDMLKDVQMHIKTVQKLFLGISTLEDEITALSRSVGHQL
jgi:hypothetical protein